MPDDKWGGRSMVDGIRVKITEKYKIPPKIVLPIACQNCGHSKSTLTNEYDFRLERNVLSKMAQLKKIKEGEAQKRAERLKAEMELADASKKLQEIQLEESSESSGVQRIQQSADSAMLTPVSVVRPACSSAKPALSHFNYSEFETDTSSPFDNMELKTINDMEVLASVLSSTPSETISVPSTSAASDCKTSPPTIHPYYVPNKNGMIWNNMYSSPQYYETTSAFPNTYDVPHFNQPISAMNQNNWNNGADVTPYHAAFSEPNAFFGYPYLASSDSGSTFPTHVANDLTTQKNNSKSVPDLVQELEKELKEMRESDVQRRKTKTPPPRPSLLNSTGLENWKPWPELESPRHVPPNLLQNLRPSLHGLATSVCEMGFPMDQVVRAFQFFDGDDRKVIEFLLQVKSIEEKVSYPAVMIEKALHNNKYNEEETIKHLRSSMVLLDLGFPEDKITKVLLQSQNDRDMALEKLINGSFHGN